MALKAAELAPLRHDGSRWTTMFKMHLGLHGRCRLRSRNLIAPDESYRNVLQEIIRPARDVLHADNLKGFHEL